ncbi:hypothetical protein D0Z07_4181 [Hyphodiscus hymeniophilus]|uniref:Uncharacterized protein n=1 Tax=Hyphodiscus hymeniophilus TaxID=353542 RepID=A0A9P6VK44_9HELO|nr:hypothetical protein D0Z07_4181 [Hyphodiscus hymeniophilus]
MAFLDPVYTLIVPFLFVFTLPLAIFATITTTLAFSILLFRVILIYIELALAVIPHYLLGLTSSSRKASTLPRKVNPSSNPVPRRRKRRSSTSSNLSGGTVTPVPGDTLFGLSHSVGPTRDFEGSRDIDEYCEDEDTAHTWDGLYGRWVFPPSSYESEVKEECERNYRGEQFEWEFQGLEHGIEHEAEVMG